MFVSQLRNSQITFSCELMARCNRHRWEINLLSPDSDGGSGKLNEM